MIAKKIGQSATINNTAASHANCLHILEQIH